MHRTCWDGVNLDSPNHREHVAYPATGTFESGGACPSTHPVRLPQILLETVWDTRAFNNKADWPVDGSQVSHILPFTHTSPNPTTTTPSLRIVYTSDVVNVAGTSLTRPPSPSHGPPQTTPASAPTPTTSSGGKTTACRRRWTVRHMSPRPR
jgi:hypothetical protein